ncbi:MAG: hypothetical protein JXM70_01505 [Pirellulales bacterium]|nr:hypothetical protein [Pirellulales bacterium]
MRSLKHKLNSQLASRRDFLARTANTVSASAVAAGLGMAAGVCNGQEKDNGKDAKKQTHGCLDYGLSFICNPSPANSARFWIESRTTIIDDSSGVSLEFYQCASCKSENTFGEKDLFLANNYDFLPIFGGKEAEDLLIFRRPARLSDSYRTIVKSENVWGKPILKLQYGQKVRVLNTWEDIRDATSAAVPIVSRTEISNPQTKLRAIIECPVKTMNIAHPSKKYQVDTGPVALADLTSRPEPLIDCLSLAFVAFNAPHFADFVVEQPTAVTEGDKELCKIYHYSNPISLPAKNTLLALG